MKRAIEYLWYIVITTAIWGTTLGGISVPGLGTMSPYRILIIILIGMIISVKLRNKSKIKKSNLILLTISLVLLVYNLFFVLDSNNDPINMIQKLLNYAFGIMLIIIGKIVVVDKKIFIRTIKILIINLLVISIWGIYESFTGNYVFPVNERTGLRLNTFGLYSPVVCFFNTNGFATFYAIMIPWIYSISIFKNKLLTITFKFGIVILSVVLSVLAGARAACMLILAFILLRIIWGLRDRKKAIFAILVVISIIIACGTIWKEQTDVILNEIFSINSEDNSTNIRITIMKNGIRELEKSKYIGIGMGNFENKMKDYNNTQGVFSSHNLIVELLVENGIVLFLVILITFLNMFRKLVEKYTEQNMLGKSVMINVLFLIIAFPILTSINSTTYAYMPMWIMVMLFSVIANNNILTQTHEEENVKNDEDEEFNN